MKNILYLSTGETKSPTRYRALVYFERLKAAGWQPEHMTIKRNFNNKWQILKQAKTADAVVVMRKTLPGPFLYLLRKVAKKLIYDFDDALFCREDGSESPQRMARLRRMVKHCDHVWAGNHYLANIARQTNPNVTYLPTGLCCADYQVEVTKPTNTFDLVWVGSRATKIYLNQVIPILEKLSKAFPSLRLKIIADFTINSEQLAIVNIPWDYQTQIEHIASAHVGIAPMIDNAWTRGKCALKVVQYMAAGLPVITSPVGVNKEAIINGETGFYADTYEQWQQAITALQDTNLRERFAATTRLRCQQQFDLEVLFESILRDIT